MSTPKKKTGGRTTAKKTPQVTSAAEWAGEASKPIYLTVPTGKTCLVKKAPGLHTFLKQGMIPNTLLALVQESLNGKAKKVDQVAKEAVNSPDMLRDMMTLQDAVVCDVVIEPPVAPVPLFPPPAADDVWLDELHEAGLKPGDVIPPHLREKDVPRLYVDYIDDIDKQFIFQYATGGSQDLERFREEQAEAVGAVEAVAGVDNQAE